MMTQMDSPPVKHGGGPPARGAEDQIVKSLLLTPGIKKQLTLTVQAYAQLQGIFFSSLPELDFKSG